MHYQLMKYSFSQTIFQYNLNNKSLKANFTFHKSKRANLITNHPRAESERDI